MVSPRAPRPGVVPLSSRTRLRPLVLALALGSSPLWPLAHLQAQTVVATRSYAVPSGELATALGQFAEQAGVAVLFEPATVQGLSSPGVSGPHAPEEGLRRLLAGTGLRLRDSGPGAFIVVPGPTDGVTRLSTITVQGETTPDPRTRTLNRETLARADVRDWRDVDRLEPGLGFNRRTGSINLRGLQDGRVAARIDGIRLSWLDDGARGVMGGMNAVDFDSLSRLDVVRGADSATAGDGALGGTVALSTLDPEDLLRDDRTLGGLARAGHDSADRSRTVTAALAGRNARGTSWLVQAGYRRGHTLENQGQVHGLGAARSAVDPGDHDQRTALLKLRQLLSGGHRLTLTGEFFDRRETRDSLFQQGPGTSYRVGENTAHDDVRRERVSLAYDYRGVQSGTGLMSARAQVYWHRLGLDNGLVGVRNSDARGAIIPGDPFRYGFPSGAYTRSNTIEEALTGVTAEATGRLDGRLRQTWTAGAEWVGNRTEQFSSGMDNCPSIRPGTPAPFGPRACDMLHTNQADMPPARGHQWALWLRDEIAFADDRVTLTPALRYDRFRQSARATGGYMDNPNAGALPPAASGGRASPSLLAQWQALPSLSLYAQYAHAFKAPSATQLFTNYGGPGTYLRVGNPDLKPETSRGWELGAHWGDASLGGSVAAFDQRYRDFIENNIGLDASSPQWQAGWAEAYPLGVTGMANRSRVRIYGAEATAQWRFAPGWRTWGGLAWAVGKDTLSGEHLNSVAPLKASLGLGYARERWGVDAVLTAAARRDKVTYPEATADAPNADFQAPGYGVVDFTAFWRPAAVDGLRVQLGVYNVFDRTYWEAINVPTAGPIALPRPVDWYTEPGRSVRVSLTYQY